MSFRLALAAVLFSMLAGCLSGARPPISVDRVPLGKVVVYRNGVAYYERRAQVQGGKLTVRVPRDRVDDFLKSLTVVDAKTQRPLPVTFPRQQASDAAVIDMQLDVGGAAGAVADVVMTYVTDAAAWKPSYRLVLAGDHTMLEGWAIVDNLSGEDWKDVVVGVGSSSAMSFRYDLWSVRTVEREQLASDEQFAVAPPNAVSPYGGSRVESAGSNQHLLVLDAAEIRDLSNLPSSGVVPPAPAPQPQPQPQRGLEGSSSGAASIETSEVIVIHGRAPVIDPGSTTTGMTFSDDYTRNIPVGRSFGTVVGAAAGSHPDRDPAVDAYDAVTLGDRKLGSIAPQLIKSKQYVVVEGYAAPGEANAQARGLDRANVVRNQLIDAGVSPGRVRAVGKGAGAGRASVQLVTETAPAAETAAGGPRRSADTHDEQPVGESHFDSGTPMTVGDGTSAMVSVLRAVTSGREVYLYDGDGERGNARFAFKAVRLINPTDSTLEAGPVTVYGEDRYIGEGLTEPIGPHQAVVIPYALDRQIVVERTDDTADELAKLVTVQRGLLTAEVQHVRTTRVTLTSRLRTPSTVYVRHALEPGWILMEQPLPTERLGDALLLAVELAAGETRTIELREATPMTRQLELGATATLDLLSVYVASPHPTKALRAQLANLLGVHRALFDTVDKIDSLRERAHELRVRSAELEDQLRSLRKVKTAVALSRQLAGKAGEMATRLQATTIAIVEAQEQVMLLRVEFQDALAELHLPDAMAVAAAP